MLILLVLPVHNFAVVNHRSNLVTSANFLLLFLNFALGSFLFDLGEKIFGLLRAFVYQIVD